MAYWPIWKTIGFIFTNDSCWPVMPAFFSAVGRVTITSRLSRMVTPVMMTTSIKWMIERFSYGLEMKTRAQNRNYKRTEIERFHWFIERINTHVAFGWLNERSGEKTSCPRELSRNQLILRFDVILQSDWPIEQCLLHIGIFFGGKTKRPCFDLFIH